MRTIILLGTRGIPARHGAFEQFAEVFCQKYQNQFNIIVFCEGDGTLKSSHNVRQIFIKKMNLPGYAILYDVFSIFITVFRLRKLNPTVFIFGYTASPFFFLLKFFKIKFWVNTDGYEYRRDKFGSIAKIYLRWAEKCAAFFAKDNLITDSSDLVHYFNYKYGITPVLIAYGFDEFKADKEQFLRHCTNNYDVCVQRLEPENNIKMIVDAYSNSNRTLILIGPTTDWFEKNIKPFLPQNVHYIGSVYDRKTLNEYRYFASNYIHGHSVGGMNPVLIESLKFDHIPIVYLTPHNYEVYGKEAYYFYDKTSLNALLRVESLKKCDPDPMYSRERFNWDTILDSYINLI